MVKPGGKIVQAPPHPLLWRQEKLGTSGTRYKLVFHGTTFHRMSALVEYTKGPGRPLYWRLLWDRGRKIQIKPHSKLLRLAFADLGFGDPVVFVEGRHVRFELNTGLDSVFDDPGAHRYGVD